MRKEFLYGGILLVITVTIFVWFYQVSLSKLPSLVSVSSFYEDKFGDLTEKMSEALYDLPQVADFLPNKSGAKASPEMSSREVIVLTNVERQTIAGLPALRENETLNLVAKARLLDMFERQYFAHVSPVGNGVTTTAKTLGYRYIAIAENIALGDFDSEAEVVSAWMKSSGHRANILSSKYEEIGVAIGYDFYEGDKTWILVQVFGRPLSSCVSPDHNLKTSIDAYEETLASISAEAQDQLQKLNNWSPTTNEEVAEYNKAVETYNALVKTIRSIQNTLKLAVEEYNIAVKSYNNCLAN